MAVSVLADASLVNTIKNHVLDALFGLYTFIPVLKRSLQVANAFETTSEDNLKYTKCLAQHNLLQSFTEEKYYTS